MDPLANTRVPDLGSVESQLAELWRMASTDDQAVIRACKMNLVVVCGDGDGDVHDATQMVARISETEPGRALVIAPKESTVGGLEVFVSAHCHRGSSGAQVCSEQVTLEVSNEGTRLIPESVLQLLVEEMPVVVWWRRPVLKGQSVLARLRDLSDRMIFNSATFRDPQSGLREVCRVTSAGWEGHASDLTWAKLEPWREALASLFDRSGNLPSLVRIRRVVISAGGTAAGEMTTAGAYLAGWLASRLDWTGAASVWQRPDGDPVTLDLRRSPDLDPGEVESVLIETEQSGSTVKFRAQRAGETGDFVALSVEGSDSGPQLNRIKLPSRDEAALFCGLIQRAERDSIYESSLEAAAKMG